MSATTMDQLTIDFPPATLQFSVRYIQRTLIRPDPAQPRQEADAELRASIARNGILQPITVRESGDDRYVIIDGERRWRGAEGILEEIPCIVRGDQENRIERLRTQLVSNTGKPLAALEEARAFRELVAHYQSIAELARGLGRPVSTVAERLQLLELGPWIAWVEDGRIPLSYAVRALLPLRECPDTTHTAAVASFLKGRERELAEFRSGKTDALFGDFEDFRWQVRDAYREQMYPLTKAKGGWDPVPRFNTKAHDTECDCGGIVFDFDGGGTARRCCANPAWWKPRDKKSKAEARKQAASGSGSTSGASRGREQRVWYVPEGTPTLKHGWGDAPKGVVFLTATSGGTWDTSAVPGFDPSALPIDPAKLVVCRGPSGDARVGTKDAAAVKAAREAWATRWRERRTTLVRAFAQALKEQGKAYRVAGAGTPELLAQLRLNGGYWHDLADAAGVGYPEGIEDSWAGDAARTQWLRKLDQADAEKLLTALAYLTATKTQAPSSRVTDEIRVELERIAKRAIPWAKPPKGATASKGASKAAGMRKPATQKAALLDDDEEFDDEDLDADE